jgi:AraC-like DNA-binding protein
MDASHPAHAGPPSQHNMVVEWSTAGLAPGSRFEHWREACCQHVYALTPQRHALRERLPFAGRMQRHVRGPLDVVDIHCDGHLVQRRPEDISARPSDTCYIYLQLEGRAWFDQRQQRIEVTAGDIVIADPNVAFSTGAQDHFDFRLWRLQRARLASLLAGRGGEMPMIKLDRGHGDTALLASWLDALLRQHGGLSDAALDIAFGTLGALVANSAGLAPDLHEQARPARRAALLQRALRAIEMRAAEPELDAVVLARELSVSLRSLQQLFENTGCSVHERITQQRLERAHALLLDPSWRRRGITHIGLAAGFSDTSTFYRRFRQRYGVAPGELRAGAFSAGS